MNFVDRSTFLERPLAERRQLPVGERAEVEREYLANREAVLGMLRADFGGLPDLDELYHDAWAELLELRAAGTEVRNTRGLLKTIAWRRARDRLRKTRPQPVDPTGYLLLSQADDEPSPAHHAQVKLDAAALRQVIESLEPRQAAALKLRFDWGLDGREIQERLGVSAKRLEKIVTEAYRRIAEEIDEQGGESSWSRRQRSLLLACEMGVASPAQRARAQRMLENDPHCRALLYQMRSALRDVAALLPFPVLFEDRTHLGAPVLERAADAWAALKQNVPMVSVRGTTAAEQIGGAGTLGFGGGAAMKAVAACLAAGGTAAVCFDADVFEHLLPHHDPPPKAATRARPSAPRRAVRVSLPVQTATAKPTPVKPKTSRPKRPATSSPSARPDASPAPSGSTEFGAGSIGSSSATSAPATAPTDGGGEFGP
jgi:RNA polymerase sigma factor (sigma-70 family)